MHVGLFAVIADVEPDRLVIGGRAQRDDESDELEQKEADDAAVNDCHGNCGGLDADLPGITEEGTIGEAIQRPLREHASQQRANSTSNPMSRDNVERIVK